MTRHPKPGMPAFAEASAGTPRPTDRGRRVKGKRPDYTVSTVVPTDGGDRWREVGVAFASDEGDTITVLLDALPVTGKLVLRPPRQRPASTPAS